MASIIPYREFLKRKELREQETGITVSSQQLHPSLFDWQKRIVTWACKVGRAAVWADTGLGKTRMQLEWLRQVCAGHGTGLILAPLAVCQQTIREGAAIGMEVRYVHDQSEVSDGFNITNYERVPKLDVSKFNAVVLDEASILKQSDGKTRKMLIDTFRDTKYRLACTATPAPNDPEELCNQAEFLDFADGNIPVLITKGSMASFGLNWQNCARMAFCGLNDSWESYYQSIRRCYRFGQKRVVDVHVVVSDLEREIAENITRKEQQATHLSDELVKTMNESNSFGKAA